MENNTKGQIEILNQQIKEIAGRFKLLAACPNVSENEFWILYSLIILEGEYSQHDISSIWSIPKQTVNSIITQMVKNGLASLEVEPGTRNRKIVRLTEKGREYGECVVMPAVKAEQSAFEKLEQEDRNAFIVAFGKYINILKEEINETADK